MNLTGASRLILYDIDWNPANDMQVALCTVCFTKTQNHYNFLQVKVSIEKTIENTLYILDFMKIPVIASIVAY